MHILTRLLERWTSTRIVPDSTSHPLIIRPSMPVPRELRTFGPLPTLYPHDENTPLIRFNEHDAWTISDSFQGCCWERPAVAKAPPGAYRQVIAT